MRRSKVWNRCLDFKMKNLISTRQSIKIARRTDDLLRLHGSGGRCWAKPRHAPQDQVMWFDVIGCESTKLAEDVQRALEFLRGR